MTKLPILGTCVLILGMCGCASMPASHDYCLAYHPVLTSKQDHCTDGTDKQVLANNETYKRLCK